jgi:hypothetical protein
VLAVLVLATLRALAHHVISRNAGADQQRQD